MYVESWVIAVVLILVIYLLYELHRVRNGIQELERIINEYTIKSMVLRRELINLLLFEDSRFLTKVTQKTRDKILSEQANDIRIMFANSIVPDRVLAGQTIKDNTVEEYLRDAFGGYHIEYSPSDAEITNLSIKAAMERKIDEYK